MGGIAVGLNLMEFYRLMEEWWGNQKEVHENRNYGQVDYMGYLLILRLIPETGLEAEVIS